MADTNWYGNCYRQGFKNLGGTKMVETFDARQLVKHWQEAGAELVFMNVFYSGYALYPSKLTVQDPNLKGRDLVKQFVDACKEFGVRPGGYVTPQNHYPFMAGHPDWCQTKTDGTLHLGMGYMLPDSPYSDACFNAPIVEKLEELLRESFSRYKLDAAFFDNAFTREGICQCRFCKEKFKALTGHDLPKNDDWSDAVFRRALQFKYDTFREGMLRLVKAAREQTPDLAIVHNNVGSYCHWNACHGEQFTEELDYACSEQVVASAHSLDTLGSVHETAVGVIAYNQGLLRGKSRSNRKVHAYNYVVEPASNARMDLGLKLELLGAAAFGGVLAIQGGQPAVKKIFDILKQAEPYLADTTPVPYAAILSSQISFDMQYPEKPGYGYGDLKGMFNSLQNLNVPTEFISSRALEAGETDNLSVMILSDVAYISPAQAQVIRDFVSRGGGLIATCQTSLMGEDGKVLPNFALADVLGVDAAGELYQNGRGQMLFDTQPWAKDVIQRSWDPAAGDPHADNNPWYPEFGELVYDPAQPVKLRSGAKELATYLFTGEGDGQTTMPPKGPAWPAVVQNTFGKGKVVYISTRFGETYARLPFPLWRKVMELALKFVSPTQQPIEVKAPACVTVKAWEQPQENGRWVIHLLNDLDATGRAAGRGYGGLNNGRANARPREGTVPVDNVEILVRKDGAKSARLVPQNCALKVEQVDGGLLIKPGPLDMHTMIVVE